MKSQAGPKVGEQELNRLDDPAVVQRCVKLEVRSDGQQFALAAGLLACFLGVCMLMVGYVGWTSRYHQKHHPPIPAFIPFGWTTAGLGAALLLGAFFIVDNYYLVDPVERRVYRLFQFLAWRRRNIVFRDGELQSISSEERKTRGPYRFLAGGYRIYRSYRVVAAARNGRREAFTNWKLYSLEECNAKTVELAGILHCKYEAAAMASPTAAANET